MKKLSIVGAGTAGAVTLIKTLYEKASPSATSMQPKDDLSIDWYYDPSIKAQPVGEGTTLAFSNMLADVLNLYYPDITEKFDYCPKEGIYYYNFGQSDFFHPFAIGASACHFNAAKLQDYMLEIAKKEKSVNVIEKNITDLDDIDADHIIDCRGKPKNLDPDEYYIPEFISVNAVHVTQCYWDSPKFRHTKTIARPYGWVFMVPLNNRCSVGYLYNRNFNTLEEVKDDVNNVFEEWGVTPSENTNSFIFDNYHKKEIHTERVTYQGNKSFFLEPMEATSIDSMFHTLDIMNRTDLRLDKKNEIMRHWFEDCEFIIMLHYAAGSKWDNPFWDYAKERGERCMQKYDSIEHPRSYYFIKYYLADHFWQKKIVNHTDDNKLREIENKFVGPWQIHNFRVNYRGLGFTDDL